MATSATSSAPTKGVAAKLLIRAGTRLWVSDDAIVPVLGTLPDDAAIVERAEEATVALLVAREASELRELLRRHAAALRSVAVAWVAYPKVDRVDLNRDSVWPILADRDFRPVGQAAIGDAWSAMRFRALAPGEPRFTGGR